MAQFEYLTIELIVPWSPSICTIRSEGKSARLEANSAPHSGERAQSMAEEEHIIEHRMLAVCLNTLRARPVQWMWRGMSLILGILEAKQFSVLVVFAWRAQAVSPYCHFILEDTPDYEVGIPF